MLIKQTKSLIKADKVAGWAYNDRKSPIGQIKLPTGWTKLPIERKEKSPLEYKLKLSFKTEIKLFSFFLLLAACFIYAFFIIAQGTSNVLMKNAYGGTIPPLYRSPHWKALALSLERDLFAYLSTFLIATSFFCVRGNRVFNRTTNKHITTI